MPCPYGINIPAIFGYYNTCLAEGLLTKGKEENAYRRARKKWLVGYDKNVEHMRQADHCIGCNKCLSHCPQRINIPQEMQKIDALVESLKATTL
jgi:predicted aldo/keto reductase-like oxidoreductase